MCFAKEMLETKTMLEALSHEVSVPYDTDDHLKDPTLRDDPERDRKHSIDIDIYRKCFDILANNDGVLVLNQWILADLVLHTATPMNLQPFRPDDIDWHALPVAPPVEVIVKRMHSGTSKHRYFGMAGYPIRRSHALYHGMTFEPDGAYPEPFVRFDWRNPMLDPTGKQLADEVLGDTMADWFIDAPAARRTALRVFNALTEFLSVRKIVCYDLCVIIDEGGTLVFGEISQDCGRFRHADLHSLDKDIWRAGGSSEDVLAKWKLLLTHIERHA